MMEQDNNQDSPPTFWWRFKRKIRPKFRYIWSDTHPYHCPPTGELCGFCRQDVGGYSLYDRVIWRIRRIVRTDSDRSGGQP